jgi:hypothetical protein
MTYKEYKELGGVETIYPPAPLPTPPEGYYWKAMYHSGELKCHKLQEKPKVSSCNCRKN